MDLFIIRHAWAGEYGDPRWPDDSQRPLSEEGTERFDRVVRELSNRGFAPEIVASSPLVRCHQTAQIVSNASVNRPEVVLRGELAPGSDFGGILQWTTDQAAGFDQVAWVGHAPDVGRLTALLIGQGNGWIRFAKGAVAAIRFDEAVAPGLGELRWLATAKMLGC